MLDEYCLELQARADMLYQEAAQGRAQARERGVSWEGYVEQMRIADRVEALAQDVADKIIEICKTSRRD